MDIRDRVFNTIQNHGPADRLTAGALGDYIADDLELIGIAVAGEHVADYLREIGDYGELTSGELADRLAEDIEADLDEEE
jgi:hypothetical protein